MANSFESLDLAPLVAQVVDAQEKKSAQSWSDDEITERVFIGEESDLEILRWSQFPELY